MKRTTEFTDYDGKDILYMNSWKMLILFCLIVWGFSFFSRIYHYHEGLLLTYARHSWPLSSEGSLAFHTYCDSGHPFEMVISKDP